MDDALTTTPDKLAVLPGSVPVTMPDIPLKLVLTTEQQWKAMNDPIRKRILNIIQHQPATAKQLATRLGASHGSIGHHLHVLEEAGLAHVVALRLVRGIIARYYTRTARIFDYDLPPEVIRDSSIDLDILSHAQEDFAEVHAEGSEDFSKKVGYPRARLSPARLQVYQDRLSALIDDFVQETAAAESSDGQVYNLCVALFRAPDYVQKIPLDSFMGDEQKNDTTI